MPMTSYGGTITFGWEFESTKLDIVDWYEPAKPRSDWPTTLSEQKKWIGKQQGSDKWGQGKELSWASFQLRSGSGAPAFLDPELKQEIFDKTWELAPRLDHVAQTVDGLFNQLDTIHSKFPSSGDAARGFQVHIVFESPAGSQEDRAFWNARIAALYRLLNDYAALKTYGDNAKRMTGDPFRGAAVESSSRLIRRLNSPEDDKIETQDDAGAWIGKYKYHYVGMRREVYGSTKPLLGLEIRSGWKKDWDRFRRLIQKTVSCLENLDGHVAFKKNRPDGALSFALEQHLEFCQNKPLIGSNTFTVLTQAASVIVKRKYAATKPGGRPDLPYDYYAAHDDDLDGAGSIVLKRWMSAFMPWEEHAAFSFDLPRRACIVKARKELERQINAFWVENKSPKTGPRKDLDEALGSYFKTFFSTTQIYKYL